MKLKPLIITIGIIPTAFLIYSTLIHHIEDKANFIINKKLDDFDGQLLIRLRENKIKQQNLLDELEDNLSKIKENQKVIQNIASLSKDNIGKVHIETGTLELSNKEHTNLSSPNGCEANRGLVKEEILFDRSYVAAPEVFTSFYVLDFANGADHRLKLEVSDITTTSFNITYVTWCDTRISQSKAKWLAIGI